MMKRTMLRNLWALVIAAAVAMSVASAGAEEISSETVETVVETTSVTTTTDLPETPNTVVHPVKLKLTSSTTEAKPNSYVKVKLNLSIDNPDGADLDNFSIVITAEGSKKLTVEKKTKSGSAKDKASGNKVTLKLSKLTAKGGSVLVNGKGLTLVVKARVSHAATEDLVFHVKLIDKNGNEILPDDDKGIQHTLVIPLKGKTSEKTEEPVVEQPAEEQPAEEQPAEEQPAEEQPAEEQPAEEQPVEEEPVEEQPAEEEPVEEEPVEEEPAEEEPVEEEPVEEEPVEEEPVEEEPVEEEPVEEEPAEEEPIEEEPIEEEPIEEEPAEEEPVEEADPYADVILNIEVNGDPAEMTAGDILTMTAVISGLDNVDYIIYWESNENGIWEKIPGTEGMMTYSVELNENNLGSSWCYSIELPDEETAE